MAVFVLGKEWLKTILQVLRANPSTKIRIVGFSDCVGSEKNNTILRRERAKRVYELINQLLGTIPQWNSHCPVKAGAHK